MDRVDIVPAPKLIYATVMVGRIAGLTNVHGATCAIALALVVAPVTAQSPVTTERWYRLLAQDGVALGHATHAVTMTKDGGEIIDTQEIALRERNHGPVKFSQRTVYRLDPAGQVRSIVAYKHIGANWSRTEAKIDGDTATIERQTRTGRHTNVLTLTAGTRFDDGEALLRGWDPATTPKLSFDQFDIGSMAVEQIVIEAMPEAAGVGGLVALRTSYDHGQLRGVSRLRLDRGGDIVSVVQPMFGTTLIVQATDKATALLPHPPYTVLLNFMVKSPYRIPPGAMQAKMRYGFGFREGIHFALPQTGDQRVAPAKDGHDGVVVDICDGCGPGLPDDPATLADALKPTAWLQSDHPRLIALAGSIVRMKVSPQRKMELLAVAARQRLAHVDFTGHVSALEAVERGSGDCTEDAAVLAALGRVAGIPTRVANGMVYTRERYHGVSNAFMPHSWTLAYIDGRWRSFDMSLGGFDSTHIALTIGDGDVRSVLAASQLSSLLDWEAMAEVKKRPAP